MNADIKGALNRIGKTWCLFEHKGKSMTYNEVKAVLEYGLEKGYRSTYELSDEEIDMIINRITQN